MTTLTLPDAVRASHALGLSIVPIDERKAPRYLKSWKPYQERRASLAELQDWLERFHPSAWAVVCGMVSGRFILDFDGPIGCETMERLGLNPHVKTPSADGYHIHVAAPDWPVKTIHCGSSRELNGQFCGLDIKADGGIAGFWGNIPISSNGERTIGRYEILRPLDEPYRFDELPEELRTSRWLAPPREKRARAAAAGANGASSHTTPAEETYPKSRAELHLNDALQAAESGNGRNISLFNMVCQLRDNDHPRDAIKETVLEFQSRAPRTDTKGQTAEFSVHEALVTMESALRGEKRAPWGDFDDVTGFHERTGPPPNGAAATDAETGTDSDKSPPDGDTPAGASPRPVIRVADGSWARNVAEAEAALSRYTARYPSAGCYQRSGLLVEPVRLPEPSSSGGLRRASGSLIIAPLTADALGLKMAAAADWKKYRKTGKVQWVDTDPPKRVPQALSTAPSAWRTIPALIGIVEAPTLRPDGSVLQEPGFDPVTGLFFDPGQCNFPTIPEKPTKKEAKGALKKLLDIVRDFPFVDEASRAVAIASILTALVRPALRSAPMTGHTAPKRGSGKTLQSYLPAYIATGRAPVLMTQAQKPEEETKRLLALLLSGSSVVVIDNIERTLQSDSLCTILSEPTWGDRILGVTRNATVSTATTWIATGNNLQFAGDLSSRVLLCSIDPECERPEERTFSVDLHAEVPRRRGELAAAALTIIRAYLTSGETVDVPVFGRFESWSRLCREPLIWLGMADPCKTREAVEADDDVRGSLAALLTAWHDAFGDEPKTLADARSKATPALAEAMMAAGEDKGAINPRRLGWFFSRFERRIEASLRFVRDAQSPKSKKSARWRVERVTEGGRGG